MPDSQEINQPDFEEKGLSKKDVLERLEEMGYKIYPRNPEAINPEQYQLDMEKIQQIFGGNTANAMIHLNFFVTFLESEAISDDISSHPERREHEKKVVEQLGPMAEKILDSSKFGLNNLNTIAQISIPTLSLLTENKHNNSELIGSLEKIHKEVKNMFKPADPSNPEDPSDEGKQYRDMRTTEAKLKVAHAAEKAASDVLRFFVMKKESSNPASNLN